MTANFRNLPGRLLILPVAPPKGHSTTPKSFGLYVVKGSGMVNGPAPLPRIA